MNFPQNLKYTNEHEWIRVDKTRHWKKIRNWLIKIRMAKVG